MKSIINLSFKTLPVFSILNHFLADWRRDFISVCYLFFFCHLSSVSQVYNPSPSESSDDDDDEDDDVDLCLIQWALTFALLHKDTNFDFSDYLWDSSDSSD